jgi:hypothetical protein
MPTGSSRALRLDPLTLPARISAADGTADGASRSIEIDRERVLVRRTVRGMRMRLNLPLACFLGVSLRVVAGDADGTGAVALVLEHRDPNLSVPLRVAAKSDDAVADWRLWGQALGRPLLVADGDGALRPPFPSLGEIPVGAVAPRRRRCTALKRRRPTIFARRMWSKVRIAIQVYRGEREIIAPE